MLQGMWASIVIFLRLAKLYRRCITVRLCSSRSACLSVWMPVELAELMFSMCLNFLLSVIVVILLQKRSSYYFLLYKHCVETAGVVVSYDADLDYACLEIVCVYACLCVFLLCFSFVFVAMYCILLVAVFVIFCIVDFQAPKVCSYFSDIFRYSGS